MYLLFSAPLLILDIQKGVNTCVVEVGRTPILTGMWPSSLSCGSQFYLKKVHYYRVLEGEAILPFVFFSFETAAGKIKFSETVLIIFQ